MTDTSAFFGSSAGLPVTTTEPGRRSAASHLPISSAAAGRFEVLVIGSPRFDAIAGGKPPSPAQVILERFEVDGTSCLPGIAGRFALAVRNRDTGALTISVDRFGTVPIYLARHGGELVFAESISQLPAELRSTDKLSSQALFNYLYFHMVPAPGSVYTGISKLPPASYLQCVSGETSIRTYWEPDFEHDRRSSFEDQANTLKSKLRDAVTRLANREDVGCFLSGGLDSSTMVGYVGEVTERPARAFTIGFDAPEYDETEYARAAAEHFGAELNVYRVTPRDIIAAINDVSTTYDEPFGNSSAVPALCCARFAASKGIKTLIAGDGGDEFFAGNARYAKQKVFEVYRHVPAALRSALFDPLGKDGSRIGSLPLLRKLGSYVRQANVPLPDRLETYNHLHRFDLSQVLTPSFLADIDPKQPLELQRQRFLEPRDADTLDRMLYLDWKFTLSDSDLPKVSRMCQVAGVDVEYPFLDKDLVEFSTTIPSARKLRGTYLRYFYRRAMGDYLPPAVLKKRKHGFGLPFGVWLIQDSELRDFAYRSLSRLESREIIAPGFIAALQSATEQDHAAYFGSMIWVLMILEEWLAAHH